MSGDRRTNAPPAALSLAGFHILLALSGGEQHGYGIMREVTSLTGGAMRLGPGTLYRTIKGLLAGDLISQAPARADPALDEERRRYYRLTNSGWAAAEAEAERLASLVRMARARRLVAADGPADGST
ncbi:MAG: PadR family transcriptional regulator [Chloroflexi bacterium]|nr:PadR family transcriptional regulator [Chloroflexota bacterium]